MASDSKITLVDSPNIRAKFNTDHGMIAMVYNQENNSMMARWVDKPYREIPYELAGSFTSIIAFERACMRYVNRKKINDNKAAKMKQVRLMSEEEEVRKSMISENRNLRKEVESLKAKVKEYEKLLDQYAEPVKEVAASGN